MTMSSAVERLCCFRTAGTCHHNAVRNALYDASSLAVPMTLRYTVFAHHGHAVQSTLVLSGMGKDAAYSFVARKPFHHPVPSSLGLLRWRSRIDTWIWLFRSLDNVLVHLFLSGSVPRRRILLWPCVRIQSSASNSTTAEKS